MIARRSDVAATAAPFTRAFGLRLALWYATLFVVGLDRHRPADLLS